MSVMPTVRDYWVILAVRPEILLNLKCCQDRVSRTLRKGKKRPNRVRNFYSTIADAIFTGKAW